ncbi:MAG: DUF5698 domain-containing protein, partial [Anaerolineae bacterium]
MFNIGIVPPTGEVLWAASLIFALRVTDVALGTVRTITIMRSRRNLAALLGFVEVTIWVVAISQVITLARGPDIAQGLRAAGYGATELLAKGKSGPVSLVNTEIPRKQVTDLLHLVNAIDSASFVTD